MIINKTIKVIVRTNPILLGYRYWIKVGINSRLDSHINIIPLLCRHHSIYHVSEAIGEFDVIIGARFKSTDKLIQFFTTYLPSQSGILHSEAFLLVNFRKYFLFKWPLTKYTNVVSGNNYKYSNHYKLDKVDRRILNILTKRNALARSVELASQLGVTRNQIRNRINRLFRNNLFLYEVHVNPEITGYEFIATIGIDVSQRSAEDVLNDILLENSYITAASLCVGRFKIMLTVRFHRYDLLDEFVHTKIPHIAGVSTVVTFLHTKQHKYYISHY